MTIPSNEIFFCAVSQRDVGIPITEEPCVTLRAEDQETFEQITLRATKALSEICKVPEFMLVAPEVVTRKISRDVSKYKPSSRPQTKVTLTPGRTWGELRRELNAAEEVFFKNVFVVSRDGGTGGIELLPLAADVIGVASGVAQATQLLVPRLRAKVRATPRVRKAARMWVSKNAGDVSVVDTFLSGRSRWAKGNLARVLDLDQDESEWLLKQCGYDPLDDGLWVRSLAEPAKAKRQFWDL